MKALGLHFTYKRNVLLFTAIILTIPLIFSCCSGNKSTKQKTRKHTNAVTQKVFSVIEPENHQTVNQGDSVSLFLSSDGNAAPDSIQIQHNNELVAHTKTGPLHFVFNAMDHLVGNQNLKVRIFFSDSISENHNLNLFVLPEAAPKQYSYKVIRAFYHDKRAYTQGLLYKDGKLFESTGKERRSSIRHIDIENGEIINKTALEPQFFGEGIAVVGNEIYMLTYVSQVGFVFDAVTLDIRRKFSLQTREGWGLTTYNNELIMSDGSASLYFFEPEYFTLNRQLEVCTNKGYQNNLNELEYTPYGLMANVYGHNYIVLIDINTGIVKGKVDLEALFPEDVPKNYDHVLNGIAYNNDKGTFYVTGKQWPVMYEITIDID
jgi:glutamine cyclotransferase